MDFQGTILHIDKERNLAGVQLIGPTGMDYGAELPLSRLHEESVPLVRGTELTVSIGEKKGEYSLTYPRVVPPFIPGAAFE